MFPRRLLGLVADGAEIGGRPDLGPAADFALVGRGPDRARPFHAIRVTLVESNAAATRRSIRRAPVSARGEQGEDGVTRHRQRPPAHPRPVLTASRPDKSGLNRTPSRTRLRLLT